MLTKVNFYVILLQISIEGKNIFGCSLIGLQSNLQIAGEGFHRRLQILANFSSSQRLIDCRISYLFQIPAGAFLDVDGLARQFASDSEQRQRRRTSCFSSKRFDVEKPNVPEMVPSHSPVFFHSDKYSSKSFFLNDQLEYPVMLRYHLPNSSDHGLCLIEFEQPHIFLRCEQNRTFMEDKSCVEQIEQVNKDTLKRKFFNLLNRYLATVTIKITSVPQSDFNRKWKRLI